MKVDREERPDVDAVYMSVCQAMNGQGGWPLTILMAPDGKPVFFRHIFSAPRALRKSWTGRTADRGSRAVENAERKASGKRGADSGVFKRTGTDRKCGCAGDGYGSAGLPPVCGQL